MVGAPIGLVIALLSASSGTRGDAHGGLRSLVVVATVARGSSPLERIIEVELVKPLACLVVPPGTRVFVDDELLTMVSAGRMLAPKTHVLQMTLAVPRCEQALFRSRPFASGPTAVTKIRVEIGRAKGDLEVEALRADRTMRLVKPGPLTPNEDVVLEWSPRSDVWPEKSLDPEVQLVGDDGARVKVDGTNLQVKDGRFHFIMPAIGPGAVSIHWSTGSPEPHVHVQS